MAEKLILFALTIVFLVLIFINPLELRRVGDFLTFGGSKTEKISPEELENKVKELKIGVKADSVGKFAAGDVYSRYPLNFKNELLVDIGLKEGVLPGGAATWNGILIGKVKEVSVDSSAIQTIFDPAFSLPVRIGKSGTDALLVGGAEPKLTLIAKSAESVAGSPVYSASNEFGYGLILGIAGPVAPNSNSVFSEANLKISYGLSDLRYLFLEIK